MLRTLIIKNDTLARVTAIVTCNWPEPLRMDIWPSRDGITMLPDGLFHVQVVDGDEKEILHLKDCKELLIHVPQQRING
jgi:hypothetical protein